LRREKGAGKEEKITKYTEKKKEDSQRRGEGKLKGEG
jgi:hypothetical protein